MKWIWIIILLLASLLFFILSTWLEDEDFILEQNKCLMSSEILQAKALQTLDRQTLEHVKKAKIYALGKEKARTHLLDFFDTYKKTFSLEILEYFQEKKDVIFFTLKAKFHQTASWELFLNEVSKMILLEFTSIEKKSNSIELVFKALYPYNEYK